MKHVIWMLVGVLLTANALGATVIVTSTPTGADVTVDGESAGKTPRRLKLAEGLHDIQVSADDYTTHTETITVGKKLMQVKVAMKPKRYPVDILMKDDSETGWVIFDGKTLVVEDGKLVTAPATIQLLKGTHKLRLMKQGFEDLLFSIVVKPNEETPLVEVSDKPKKGYSSYDRCHKALVVGEWKSDKEVKPFSFLFSADGTFTKLIGGKTSERGTWTFEKDMPTAIVVTFQGGYVTRLKLTGTQLVGRSKFTRAKK